MRLSLAKSTLCSSLFNMMLLTFAALIISVGVNSLPVANDPTTVKNAVPAAPRLKEETPTYLEVPVGERLKLRCPVGGNPKPVLEFYKGANSERIHNTERISIVRYSLNIPNVEFSDSGLYNCKAYNAYGFVWKNFTVKVIDDPRLIEERPKYDDYAVVRSNDSTGGENFAPYFPQPRKMNIRLIAKTAGSTAVLKCPAVGKPSPTIKWLKDGNLVVPKMTTREVSYKKYSLVIDPVITSDSGIYTCFVSNSEGTVSWTYKMEVQESVPHKPIILDNPSNVTVHEGETAKFECHFISELHPRMRWLRHFSLNGSYEDDEENPYVTPLESTDPNITDPHILVLQNVTKEDEGWFSCLVGNSLGVSYKSAYLRVLTDDDDLYAREHLNYEKLVKILGTTAVVLVCFVAAISVYYCKQRKKIASLKREIVIKKVVVLEREENSDDSILPRIKIDYVRTYTTELGPHPRPEYILPLDPTWEFPRTRLVLGSKLGEGAFGVVFKAKVCSPPNDAKLPTIVAVKMLKDDHNDDEMTDLVSELEVLKKVGHHMNVVSLLGCCTEHGPLMMILDYCPNGNLRDFLRLHNQSFVGSGYEVPSTQDGRKTTLTEKDLVSFSYQISKGMEYLASKKIIHRDLAARNVLISHDHVVKIADFGLARDIHGNDYYKKTKNTKLPVKWMAIEALYDRIFTFQSDVWSFGILLWEICTLGATPYATTHTENLYNFLKTGNRMEKPAFCSTEMYGLMRDCWIEDPKLRPSFSEITRCLDSILLYAMDTVYLELEFKVLDTPENSAAYINGKKQKKNVEQDNQPVNYMIEEDDTIELDNISEMIISENENVSEIVNVSDIPHASEIETVSEIDNGSEIGNGSELEYDAEVIGRMRCSVI